MDFSGGSNEHGVWLFGLLGLIGVLVVLGILSRQQSPIEISDLHRDQRGGAYTLNYLLAVFCLFLFLCVIVECAQILLARAGIVYAGFAAARTAVVHGGEVDQVALSNRAAQRAFVPFSRGLREHDSEAFKSDDTTDLWRAYASIADAPVQKKYFLTKERSAAARIRVTLERPTKGNDGEPWKTPLVVSTSYRYPLMFPFLGVVLGVRQNGEYFRPMQVQITMPMETPQNQEEKLGITYGE